MFVGLSPAIRAKKETSHRPTQSKILRKTKGMSKEAIENKEVEWGRDEKGQRREHLCMEQENLRS